mmetsp:Transcript_1981/g.3169  ORF Transcript_1981/g.3169 Transcript_1981/m.3169 type:complete len:491 (-) Transcript_1981:42-1514(-)
MGNKHSNHLIDSVSEGNTERALELIAQGASPNQVNQEGKSCIRIALERDYPVLFKKLYLLNAQMIPSLHGTTLHKAVSLPSPKVVKLLLQDKAFPNFKNSKDQLGKTPLHIAVARGDSQLVDLLLKHNASPYIKDKNSISALDLSLQLGFATSIFQQFNDCELQVAVPQCQKKPKKPKTQSKTLMDSSTVCGSLDSEPSRFLKSIESSIQDLKIPLIPYKELKLSDQISKGSSCEVFKAKWRGSDVAVKKFHTVYSSSQKDMQKLLKEVHIIAQIRHPNLLLFMGVSIDSQNICLVSELVNNCNLFQAIHKAPYRPLTLEDKLRISLQIVRGLWYLHGNSPQVVHRDLKPENILLDETYNVKLADFGLARPVDWYKEELTSICIGTPRFMAPELFEKSVDKPGVEVDIWAFGCLLIEIFSGKRPWAYIPTSKANVIYFEIFQKKPVPIPSNIPKEIVKIIKLCCSYNPQARPKTPQLYQMLQEASNLLQV